MHQHPQDEQFMQEALQLGVYALGRTAPNPSVGAVIVNHDEVVGRGWTQPVGEAHAEIVALREAGRKANGSTLYVTLEPCSHHGRTPPCIDAIIQARVARCVVAVEDPFALVSGQGIARLRAAGIRVDVGLHSPEAAELHAGYFMRIRNGRPLVRAKYAMTLDGRIATRTGNSQWITGPMARRHAHVLRDRSDAVLVGAGTVQSDDPSLTTRLPEEFTGDGGAHHALRIVLDGRGTTSPAATVYDAHLPGHTLVVTTAAASQEWLRAIGAHGGEPFVCGDGPVVDIERLLQELGRRGINELLVEGGGSIFGSFFNAGFVDRVAVFIAPIVIGGSTAPGPVGGEGVEVVAKAWRISSLQSRWLGGDLMLEGTVSGPPSTVEDI